MNAVKYFFRILTVALTALLLLSSWWATQKGWSLPHVSPRGAAPRGECPTWQRDAYGNCPPQSHRLQLGSREHEDNRGK